MDIWENTMYRRFIKPVASSSFIAYYYKDRDATHSNDQEKYGLIYPNK